MRGRRTIDLWPVFRISRHRALARRETFLFSHASTPPRRQHPESRTGFVWPELRPTGDQILVAGLEIALRPVRSHAKPNAAARYNPTDRKRVARELGAPKKTLANGHVPRRQRQRWGDSQAYCRIPLHHGPGQLARTRRGDAGNAQRNGITAPQKLSASASCPQGHGALCFAGRPSSPKRYASWIPAHGSPGNRSSSAFWTHAIAAMTS